MLAAPHLVYVDVDCVTAASGCHSTSTDNGNVDGSVTVLDFV